jgi:abequosyltransferase
MLTIYIPTYNRIAHLRLVLSKIFMEIEQNIELDKFITIIISNNASTDGTNDYLQTINHKNFIYIKRESNIGATENILDSVNHCKTKYLWILGDDDIPKKGIFSLLKKFLCDCNPNLVYLPAKWISNIFEETDRRIPKSSKFLRLTSAELVKKTGIKITFISSFIIDCEYYKQKKIDSNYEVTLNSNFPILEFLMPALLNEAKNYIFNKISILATGNDTFSYSLIHSFGLELPNVLEKLFVKRVDIAQKLIISLLIGYLPSMIYIEKFNKLNQQSINIPWDKLQKKFTNNLFYWIYIYPLKFLPKYLALPLIISGRLINRK